MNNKQTMDTFYAFSDYRLRMIAPLRGFHATARLFVSIYGGWDFFTATTWTFLFVQI